MAKLEMVSGSYRDENAISDLINNEVAWNSHKNTTADFVNAHHIDLECIAGSMIEVSRYFSQDYGTHAYHFILSFSPDEVPPLIVLDGLAYDICYFFYHEFQIIYSFHNDENKPHLHFVLNAISYVDGHRFRWDAEMYHRFCRFVRWILGNCHLREFHYAPFNPDVG